MPGLNIDSLSFDHGINEIVYARKGETSARQLPDRQELPPSLHGVKAQLADLLETPSIDQFLDASLRPEIVNPELLMPGKFSQSLSDTIDGLAAATDGAGEDARTLDRALRLLKEESSLRDLVSMYRSALYQG